ncbi:MAG: SurA N-terminal domain-containing protein [Nitrospirota bacterium]
MRNKPSGRSVCAAGVAICMFVLSAAAGRAELIDRVVASVNNDVVTLSELRQTIAFNAVLGGNKGNEKHVEAEALQGIINRRLLLQEAYRLKVAEVSDQDAAAEVARLRKRLATDAAFQDLLERTDMNEQQLARLLGERLLVERFVEKKIGLFARVSRDDAQSYYKEHAIDFKGRRFAEVQKQITEYLSAQKVSQQLDQYIDELRNRAVIRTNDLREER